MSSLSTKHIIVLNLMVSFMICQEWHKKFCEEDIIDAVVVGKNHFSLTRGQWTADYDEKTGTVGPYIRSILPDNEFYQSAYVITNVDIPGGCNKPNTPKDCSEIRKLKDLEVVFTKDYKIIAFNNKVYFYRNGVEIDAIRINWRSLYDHEFLDDYHERKQALFIPEGRPGVMIMRVSEDNHQNYKLSIKYFDDWKKWNDFTYSIVNITGLRFTAAFWWPKTKTIYFVAEDKSELLRKHAFIYKFDFNQLNSNPFIATGISVNEFFGCKTIATMTSAMSTGITTQSINNGTESTQRVDETTNQTEKTTSNVDNTDGGLSSLTTTTGELRPIVIKTTTIREEDFWSSWEYPIIFLFVGSLVIAIFVTFILYYLVKSSEKSNKISQSSKSQTKDTTETIEH